LYNIITC